MSKGSYDKKKFATRIVGLALFVLSVWISFPELFKTRLPVLTNDLTFDRLQAFRTTKFEVEKNQFTKFGKELFFDPRLSRNGQISCATCHQPEKSFTDGRTLARGLDETQRNVPTLINQRANSWFFWDGRADTLTSQALNPLLNEKEHGLDAISLAQKIIQFHGDRYKDVFGPSKNEIDLTSSEHQYFFASKRAPMQPSVAMYGIASIGSFRALDWILSLAGHSGISPQKQFMELSNNASSWSIESKHKLPESVRPIDDLPENMRAFVTEVLVNSAASIEAFERTIVAYDSPFDRYLSKVNSHLDLEAALNPDFGNQELLGLKLFLDRGKCSLCHSGPNFTDSQFHNVGLAWNPLVDQILFPTSRAEAVLEIGESPLNCNSPAIKAARAKVGLPRNPSCDELEFLRVDALELVGAFKTPTLRNLTKTGPYMHDGRFKTLAEVIEHYDEMNENSAIGHKEETLQPLSLTKKERAALNAFLESLNSPVSYE